MIRRILRLLIAHLDSQLLVALLMLMSVVLFNDILVVLWK